MRQKSLKDYWRYIISLNKTSYTADIGIEQTYEHSKAINEMNDNDYNVPDSDFNAYSDDTHLNSEITQTLKLEKPSNLLKIIKAPTLIIF